MFLKQVIIENLKQLLPTVNKQNAEEFASHISKEIAEDCQTIATSDPIELKADNAAGIVVWLRDNYVFRIVDYFRNELTDKYNNMDPVERTSLMVFKRYTAAYKYEDEKKAAIAAILLFRNIGDYLVEKYDIETEVKTEIAKKEKR